MKTKFQIYVGTYAKYNNGSLSGKWFNLSDYSDKKEFMQACNDLHSDEVDPELMFQDWENIPESYISESDIDGDFWDLLNSDINIDAFIAFSEYFKGKKISDFKEDFQGEWNSEENFAEQLFDDIYMHDVPENIRHYIDYSAFARDIFMSDYTFVDGYVFLSH